MDSSTRADRVRELVEAYGQRSGLDRRAEDAYTLVGDLIADLLHLVTSEGADWREAANRGIWHFRAETVYPDGVGDEERAPDGRRRQADPAPAPLVPSTRR